MIVDGLEDGAIMDVHGTILNFRAFLNSAYEPWAESARDALERGSGFLDEMFEDWAQANWELLVERSLCGPGEYLELYGSGSDYETALHSRVFFHSALPTHRIVCTTINDEPARDILSEKGVIPSQCSFEGFAARSGEWFEAAPPFDHVVLELDKEVYVVPVSAVTFELDRIAIPTDPLSQRGGATPRG